MKRIALFLSALILAVGAQRLSAEDSVPAPMPPRPLADVDDDFAAQERIVIQARFCESDSIEDRDKGNLRVVSQPTILTLAGQSFSIHLGGERLVVDHAAGDVESMEVGLRLEGKVGAVRGGTIRVSVSFSHTAVQSADDDGGYWDARAISPSREASFTNRIWPSSGRTVRPIQAREDGVGTRRRADILHSAA